MTWKNHPMQSLPLLANLAVRIDFGQLIGAYAIGQIQAEPRFLAANAAAKLGPLQARADRASFQELCFRLPERSWLAS